MRLDILFFVLSTLVLSYFTATAGTPNFQSKNPYEVLGVSPSDKLETIEHARRKLFMQYHPDRITANDPQLVKEYTAIFKTVKEAYEDIVSNASTKNYSSSSDSSSQDPFSWFRDFVQDVWGAEPDFQEFRSPRSKERHIEPRPATLFDKAIGAVYYGSEGILVEVDSYRTWYWNPKGSKIFHRLYVIGDIIGGGLGRPLTAQIYDPLLPSGRAPFVVRDDRAMMGQSVVFYKDTWQSATSLEFQQKLAQQNYQVFDPGNQPRLLNVWHYHIFKRKDVYYILASTSTDVRMLDNSSYLDSNAHRLYIGTAGNMKEYKTYFDSKKRLLMVPDKNIVISAFFSQEERISSFDRLMGMFMGFVDSSQEPLRIYEIEKHMMEILTGVRDPSESRITGSEFERYFERSLKEEIPSISREEKTQFSFVKYLGDLIMPPAQLQTPLNHNIKHLLLTEPPASEKKRSKKKASSREMAIVPALKIQELEEWIKYPHYTSEYFVAQALMENSVDRAITILTERLRVSDSQKENTLASLSKVFDQLSLSDRGEEYKALTPILITLLEESPHPGYAAAIAHHGLRRLTKYYQQDFFLDILASYYQRGVLIEISCVEPLIKWLQAKDDAWYRKQLVPRIRRAQEQADTCRAYYRNS